MFSLGERVAIWIVPVTLAIILHELAHGFVALCLGDSTARDAGRLSLNPMRHIDPIGSLLVPVILYWLGGFIFGWARAVPVTFSRLKLPPRDTVLVALAGPAANFLMGLGWAWAMRLALAVRESAPDFAFVLLHLGAAGVFINAAVMMLNLLPLSPLDGGRILIALLPARPAQLLSRIEPYGMVILLGLILAGLLGRILWPFTALGMAVFTHLGALPVGLFTGVLGKLW